MKPLVAAFVLSAFPSLAHAQELSACEDWKSDVRAIAEPWEENTRTFANGNVRLTRMDTIEPGAAAFHLLVLSPPYAELGDRQCRVISFEDGFGFFDIHFDDLEAAYDPTVGLIFDVPVELWNSDANSVVRGLHFTLNQATGEINAELRD